MSSLLAPYRQSLQRCELTRTVGHVRQLGGLTVEVEGLRASVGDLFTILASAASAASLDTRVLAEVVAVKADSLLLMPYGSLHGLSAGCEVISADTQTTIGVGDALLGRVIDGFGTPLDGKPAAQLPHRRALRASPCNPMTRPRISERLDSGVRVIDSLLTLGKGQRMGIFAGSGVGKSTLLGMIARHVKADVNVIALIGERGREVRDFIELQLGPDGLARSVVVVAASDQPALSRLRAANAALAIAEHFRDLGKQVLLTMDSVTRFAMARREVGLAAGEPPTARGYTPSVFAELPQLCERCGTAASGGSITALMTVLVEGDDMNEPVSDNMRAILDGHIVLSRQLAHSGQYPAIDVLQSASRVMADVVPPQQLQLASQALRTVAMLERNRQLVDIGAYEAGSNAALDQALAIKEPLHAWMRQREGGVPCGDGLNQLAKVLSGSVA
ncbi:MAG: FliI/YscN family ATPase [Ramlibacter sp.]|nr:FliI/YscN family ATPase [Ramlibacter sp.]